MNSPSCFYFPAPRLARFCNQCGLPVTRRIPPEDTQERDICDHCGAVHYQNPRVVVGTVTVCEERILLCRRAIQPRAHTWTLPAGFMELDETTTEGATRETLEESGAQIHVEQLFTVIDVPKVNQVHVYYLAHALDMRLAPGPESLEARYYEKNEIPWHDLSFQTVSATLRYYFKDYERGVFKTHHKTLYSNY